MNNSEDKNEENDQIKSLYGDSDLSLPDDLLVPDLEESNSGSDYEARNIKDDVDVSFKFCFL